MGQDLYEMKWNGKEAFQTQALSLVNYKPGIFITIDMPYVSTYIHEQRLFIYSKHKSSMIKI